MSYLVDSADIISYGDNNILCTIGRNQYEVKKIQNDIG